MRSLFIKIFLWFWFANTLVIGAFVLARWIYPPDIPPGGGPERLHEMQVRGALAVRELYGNEAFDRQLRWVESASAIDTFWLDEDGREIRGRTVPDRVLRFARDHASEIRRGEKLSSGPPPHILAIPLTDSKGHKYSVLVDAMGGPPPLAPRVFTLRMVPAVLVAGLGCFALARYLTAPVWRLQQAARQLAAGDLTVRVDERLAARRDEIGDLGRDFDRMTRRVQALLFTQRRLLQDVSHELRSPLARLNVALELAAQDAGPAAGPALARVALESDRLNFLIGQLLTLSRLEGGVVQNPNDTVDLRALVLDVAGDAHFEATAFDKRVRVVRSDAAFVIGSPEMLRSGIENVMRNAVQHTAAGTEVEISLRASPDEETAIVQVRDRGQGVPNDALRSIFEPFFRLPAAQDRRTSGVGLGLAITDRAIRLHGGTVRAFNAADGGLVVELALPCRNHPLA